MSNLLFQISPTPLSGPCIRLMQCQQITRGKKKWPVNFLIVFKMIQDILQSLPNHSLVTIPLSAHNLKPCYLSCSTVFKPCNRYMFRNFSFSRRCWWRFKYVEIKCQLDATDGFYCRAYCLLNMFRAPLCPSSGAREYHTEGRCLWYLVL